MAPPSRQQAPKRQAAAAATDAIQTRSRVDVLVEQREDHLDYSYFKSKEKRLKRDRNRKAAERCSAHARHKKVLTAEKKELQMQKQELQHKLEVAGDTITTLQQQLTTLEIELLDFKAEC